MTPHPDVLVIIALGTALFAVVFGIDWLAAKLAAWIVGR